MGGDSSCEKCDSDLVAWCVPFSTSSPAFFICRKTWSTDSIMTDGYRSTTWQAHYSESNLLADLWTFYFMLLENDGRNAVLLTLGMRFTSFLEMMCAVFFGRAMIRRPGWPKETPERALLVWLLWAVDPSRTSFFCPPTRILMDL